MVRTLILFAVALPWLNACRERGAGSSHDHPPTSLAFQSVHWKMRSDSQEKITRDAFKKAALSGLRKVELRRLKVKRAVLSGDFEIAEGRGKLVLDVRVQVDSLGSPIETTLMATGAINRDHTPRDIVEKGISDLEAALNELFRVAAAGPEEWVRGLRASELDIQMLSIQLLGESREKTGIHPLAALLSDPRERVAEAAAVALVEIGDPQAVPLIIKSIKRGHLRSEVRVIETIGRLGGAEARAYLEMTAVGHELEEVRHLSRNLLKKLHNFIARGLRQHYVGHTLAKIVQCNLHAPCI